MSLRLKAPLLFTFAVIAILAVQTVVFTRLILTGFFTVEQQSTKKNIERVKMSFHPSILFSSYTIQQR